MYSAKNATLSINGKTVDYVTFGTGNQPLVIIPGLGDGLQTVKGMAMPFSITYRVLAERYKIYVFSRINELRQGYTTRDMAADVAEAMETLNLDTAYVMGISKRWNDCSMVSCGFSRKGSKTHPNCDNSEA